MPELTGEIKKKIVCLEINSVLRLRHGSSDVLGGANLSKFQVAWIILQSLAQQTSSLGLSLGLHDFAETLLLGPINDKSGSLSLLLRNLLGLDGGGILSAECQFRDRHVVENDVEISGSVGELLSDEQRDLLTLRDELGGVEFCDDALQNLVADGWQDSLVEVGAQKLVHLAGRRKQKESLVRQIGKAI